MKKKILTCAAFLLLAAGLNAQTLTIDMNTGMDQNTNPIPLGDEDDTWEIKKPGGNYGPVYVSTGYHDAAHNQGETYQDILPSGWQNNVLAPYLGNPVNNIVKFPQGSPSGKYIYRMQFQYDACNTVNSARINLSVLTGAGISRILVNGNTKTLPSYSPVNFLSIDDAWNARTFNGTQIPGQTINLLPGDIQNGTNSIFIEIDPSTYINYGGASTAALMVIGHLEIVYTPQQPVSQYINLGGSPGVLCSGASGFLNVNLSGLPNMPTYNLSVSNGYIAQATTNQQIAINPPATTNYAITLTSSNGCVTTVYHQVVRPTVPTVSGNSHICAGSFGNIVVNGISLVNNYVKIMRQNGGKTPVFQGTYTGPVAVNPNVTTTYIIYVTDAYGCQSVLYWTINVIPQPCTPPGKESVPTAVKDTDMSSEEISVSPNPGTGMFKLTIASTTGTVDVINYLGVKLKSFDLNSDVSEYEIDLTNFSKGVYLLNIQSSGKKVIKRIILE